jgi:hypothetical protein
LGEAKRKAERQQLISILIPERGRPEMLDRLICSLIDTAGADEKYEILVQYDDDDEAWRDRTPFDHIHVTYLRRPRPITLGEKLNELARVAKGEILLFLANDLQMETKDWPRKVREAVAKLPNGMGVPFLKDALHVDHASYPVITRRMMDIVGFAFPPWFGAGWFIDTWWDQIGILMGVRFEIDVEVSNPEGRGKSHGLKDVTFWATFFREMGPMRMRDALHLAEIAYGQSSEEFKKVATEIGERQKLCDARTAHLITPEFAALWEANAESEPGPKYQAIKDYAEKQMAQLRKETPKRPRVAVACPSGRAIEATTAIALSALTAYSAINGVEICVLGVQSSDVSHGRNATVEIARQQGCWAILWIDSDMKFPPDALVRLIKCDKPIVGALYCKRVRDASGTYPVLGKLAGPKPEKMTDGLHEALLMPGGFMFVRMEVYEKICWPYYSFSYRYPGDDGLEAFKNFMRNTFWESAPEDALAELDNTMFGQWLKNGGYTLGEFGEQVPTFSEDLNFCRRARRAGYQLWADIKLTGEVSHLGEIAVECSLGDDVVRLPDPT